MGAILMDGRKVSAALMPELQAHAQELRARHGVVPGLAALVVGDDAPSHQYVRNKQRYAAKLGFLTRVLATPAAQASTQSLLAQIEALNHDSAISGILIQLPLPQAIDHYRLFDAIAPLKDVDGVGQAAISALYRAQWNTFLPCTPRGVLTLLRYYQVPVSGRNAVVIGRSDISGKPLAMILGGRMCDATVTWCHRHTANLAELCRQADILVSCTGAMLERPYLITAAMVKAGACVIDVGFRYLGEGRFTGDVDFAAVEAVAGWLTPNPGGTGPMTVLGLMQNVIDGARYQLGLARAQYSV